MSKLIRFNFIGILLLLSTVILASCESESLQEIEFEDIRIAEGQEWEIDEGIGFPRKMYISDDSSFLYNSTLSYTPILSYSSDDIDFKLVNIYYYLGMLASSYIGPTKSITIIIEIEKDIELTMSCNNKMVLEYTFIEEDYHKYIISIDSNDFIGKCIYGEDVFVELRSDDNVIYSESYLFSIYEMSMDFENDPVLDLNNLSNDAYIDLFLVRESSGYFSIEDIDLDIIRFGYKNDLRSFSISRISNNLIEAEIDYEEIEDILVDILSNYEKTKVCSQTMTNFLLTNCVRTMDFDAHFLLELEQGNDEYPNRKFRIGLGHYDNETVLSMFIYGANKHGKFQFRISEEENRKVKELYDYLSNKYDSKIPND